MASPLIEKLNKLTRSKDFYIGTTKWKRLTRRPLKSLYSASFKRFNRLLRGRLNILTEARPFWGGSMKVLLGEGEGTSIFLWGFIEGEELYLTKFLIEHLKPGSIFIDVGAHFGYYTLLASELVGLSGEIHSFEPTPRTFQILKQNVEGKSNVWVNQRALFREKGFIELTDFGPQGGSYNTFLKPEAYPFKFVYKDNQKIMNPIKVETTTLDRYCFDLKIKPHFIKLDVEGAEYDVLLGSEKILACHPIISLEIWGREAWQESYESVFNFLERYSYKPYWLREGRLRPYPFEKDFFFTNLIFYPAAKSV